MKLTQFLREGIARRRRRRRKTPRFKERFTAALAVQSLEGRRLLSATTSLALDSFGNLLVNDVVSGGRNDTLTIQSNTTTSRYVFSGGAGSEFSTSIAGAIGNGTSTVEIPFASVTGNKIITNTGEGNDNVTLSFTLGSFSKDVDLRMGDGQDTFVTAGTGSVSSLFIDGEAGTDTLNFNTDVTFSTAVGLNATAENINVIASADLVVSASNGSITWTSDNIAIATSATLNTGATGTVTLQQQTAGREIRLGADVTPTTLNLADAELDRITASTLQIGNSSSGSIVVTAAITQTGKNVNLVTGDSLNLTTQSFSASTTRTLNVTTGSTGSIFASDATSSDLTASTMTLNVGSGGIGSSANSIGLSFGTLNSTTSGNANQYLRSVTTGAVANLDAGTGTIRLDAGTFTLNGNERVNDATTLEINGATFALSTFTETVQGVTLTNNGTISGTGLLVSNTTFDLRRGTVSGRIGGNVGVNKSTTDTVSLTGNNTFTGKVFIEAGTLTIDADASLGTAPSSVLTDAITINADATLSSSGTYTLNANRGISLGNNSGQEPQTSQLLPVP